MRTITTETQVFNFEELSEAGKRAAIDRCYDINIDHDWYQFTFDDFVYQLEAIGFSNIEINFSGFSSQGDGASFTASDIDVEKFLKSCDEWERFTALHGLIFDGELVAKISRIGNYYCHENTVDSDIECWNHTEEQGKDILELSVYVRDFVRNKSREIYKVLNEEYDYLTGDSAIIETFEANDYEFTADGKIYN